MKTLKKEKKGLALSLLKTYSQPNLISYNKEGAACQWGDNLSVENKDQSGFIRLICVLKQSPTYTQKSKAGEDLMNRKRLSCKRADLCLELPAGQGATVFIIFQLRAVRAPLPRCGEADPHSWGRCFFFCLFVFCVYFYGFLGINYCVWFAYFVAPLILPITTKFLVQCSMHLDFESLSFISWCPPSQKAPSLFQFWLNCFQNRLVNRNCIILVFWNSLFSSAWINFLSLKE